MTQEEINDGSCSLGSWFNPFKTWGCLRRDGEVKNLENQVENSDKQIKVEESKVLIASTVGPASGVVGGLLLSYLAKPFLSLFKKGI